MGADEPGIEAWYLDESQEQQRVSKKILDDLGVLQWHLNADLYETDPELKAIRDERGYDYYDIITIAPGKLPNYEERIKSFYEEHIHTDEEIRYCLEGSGYFDVRDGSDRWIRVWTKKGDMIILPAGMYHRFTPDSNNFITVMRLFSGHPIWTAFNRPQEDNRARVEYVNNFLAKTKKCAQS
ncbi:hypothetical protein SELMODRAFT_270238 [Selaginella moellendorffii]|uniref:Acireductone dioxygenase n=1 Tax=Selaginella moellendorffii TaxID=88036 RepID=D8QNV0_SELML|nr:1,2-dihydroxy-3-keto-5-methylthiopentene dioxygenase 3 [Selaginella moellendorffii]EFJ38817.1 hypothetical protein SELMODRAFT_270238 [Selaginella moellendorffii]|eukprot:XP_002961278.1 1,2-dihydroxy-3-keto-5-methylthiopentene dioxygenase 3 [Selaginella moellendorffii]